MAESGVEEEKGRELVSGLIVVVFVFDIVVDGDNDNDVVVDDVKREEERRRGWRRVVDIVSWFFPLSSSLLITFGFLDRCVVLYPVRGDGLMPVTGRLVVESTVDFREGTMSQFKTYTTAVFVMCREFRPSSKLGRTKI